MIGAAKRRLVLSLFRCDDFEVLDALASALERGVAVHALLTKRAKGGKKGLKKLWEALEEMGAVVNWFADPVVKYHAKYLVADEGPAMIATLNPTRKCFTRTWDTVLITHDEAVVRSLLHLFHADAGGRSLTLGRRFSRRLIVGPERARADVRELIGSARRSIRILDHKLSDPEIVAQLRECRARGIVVSLLGHPLPGPLTAHGKLMDHRRGARRHRQHGPVHPQPRLPPRGGGGHRRCLGGAAVEPRLSGTQRARRRAAHSAAWRSVVTHAMRRFVIGLVLSLAFGAGTAGAQSTQKRGFVWNDRPSIVFGEDIHVDLRAKMAFDWRGFESRRRKRTSTISTSCVSASRAS